MQRGLAWLDKLESLKPFTEREAWGLFRLVALAEAFGWTLLIGGLLVRHYNLPGHTYSVLIAGRIHGLLFLTYFGILLTVYSSLRWSRSKFMTAIMAGVLPYGTLVFERWVSRKLKHQISQTLLLNFIFSTMQTD